jgi:hypothetical protein
MKRFSSATAAFCLWSGMVFAQTSPFELPNGGALDSATQGGAALGRIEAVPTFGISCFPNYSLTGTTINLYAGGGCHQLNISGTAGTSGSAGVNGVPGPNSQASVNIGHAGDYTFFNGGAGLYSPAGNELDVKNSNGGIVGVFISSNAAASASAYPTLQANGGTAAYIFSGGLGTSLVISGRAVSGGSLTLGQAGDLTTTGGALTAGGIVTTGGDLYVSNFARVHSPSVNELDFVHNGGSLMSKFVSAASAGGGSTVPYFQAGGGNVAIVAASSNTGAAGNLQIGFAGTVNSNFAAIADQSNGTSPIALTTAGYTIPANVSRVVFKPTAQVTAATITLTAPTIAGISVAVPFENFGCTACTFAPAVVGFTNGSAIVADGAAMHLTYDISSATWHRE